MLFDDRVDAGRKLADKLTELKSQNPVVLALPRGGVPIGYEIARALDAPLDVLVVRKLGAPMNPEYGIGAIAPGNITVLDEAAVSDLGLSRDDLKKIELKEREELNRRLKEYRGTDSMPDLKDRVVVLVDDGLATGVTARAAIKAVLEQNPKRLIVAMPVCALDALEGIRQVLRPLKDEALCLTTPYDLSSVASWYKSFDQVSDQEVVRLLRQSPRKGVIDNTAGSVHYAG